MFGVEDRLGRKTLSLIQQLFGGAFLRAKNPFGAESLVVTTTAHIRRSENHVESD